MAAHGITLTPQKRSAEKPPEDLQAEQSESAKLLSAPPIRTISTPPKGFRDEQVDAWVETYKSTFKDKFGALKKHIKTVQEILKEQCNKSQLTEAAVKFGLPETSASKFSIKNLSTMIAVAQYVSA